MASCGLCRTAIYPWLRVARKGGEASLQSRSATGRPRELTNKRMQRLRRWIAGKDPRQHGCDFGLWTRRIVADLIRDKYGLSLSVTPAGRLPAKLEIAPRKPLRRACERDPAAIERWKSRDYPELRARAKRRGAGIFFLGEAGVRPDSALQRTWGAKGQTPVVETSGRRQSANAIPAVNPQGAFWYNIYTGRMNAERFITFLRDFMRRRRPVFLVVDCHPAHRAKIVATYIQSLKGKMELHFLPGHAPDPNPDEFVWNHMRLNGTSKTPLRKNESLKARADDDLAAIRRSPALARSFFMAESVEYIMN